MNIRVIVLLLLLLVVGQNYSFAAFPTPISVRATSTTLTIDNEPIYSSSDTIFRKTAYRNQFHKPYRNREKEAKLSFTFGLLGLLVFAPFGIAALVLGIMSADRRNKYYNRAKWGIVLGALMTLEIILIITLIIALAL